MTSLDTIWANTQADTNTEDAPPPAGTTGVLRISSYRAGKSKAGELYFAIDVKDDAQGYSWGVFKGFTTNGQPVEGKIKSAKITLRQLGVEVDSPAQLDAALKPLVGRYYTYAATAGNKTNPLTGAFYVNTDITGVASPPAQANPVVGGFTAAPVAVQAPVAQATQVATPQGVASFPPAVAPAPVQTLEQVLAANPVGATGDDHPFG